MIHIRQNVYSLRPRKNIVLGFSDTVFDRSSYSKILYHRAFMIQTPLLKPNPLCCCMHLYGPAQWLLS
jgi:hypothetical protein